MKSFKSELKISYDQNLGKFIISGKSLTRRILTDLSFYDKSDAQTFKNQLDNQDFHFFHNHLKTKSNKI